MKRLVTTDDVTGHVLSQWSGGEEQVLLPVNGRTHRQVPTITGPSSYSGMRWNGTAFEPIPPAPVRKIDSLDFVRRFTAAEETAVDKGDEAGDFNIRAAKRRLSLVKDQVDLDHADVIYYLGYLKQKSLDPLTPTDQRVWPDAATADTRIAAIRA